MEEFLKIIVDIVQRYLRLEVEGVENIPKKGRVIIAPNHSGCAGFDAVILGHVVHEKTRRIPRILTLWRFFELIPAFQPLAKRLGLSEATTTAGVQHLKRNNLLIVFPEGETGSFKPTSQAYQLQKFHTGFVRMAILTKSPIVPCVIIGAEETHINLGTIKMSKYLRGMCLPVPFNLLPLPAKWKIKFLKPIHLDGFLPEHTLRREAMEELTTEIQKKIQAEIRSELGKRKYVYFPHTAAGVNREN